MIEAVRGSLSKHAQERADQRGIRADDIDATMQCGQMYHRGGCVIYFMGRREARDYTKNLRLQERLNGLTVVCNSNTQAIITIYRNEKSCRRIRKQSVYRMGRPSSSHPRARGDAAA